MVFNVNLAFGDLVNSEGKDEKSKKYAISLAETILVQDGPAVNLTAANRRKTKNVSIYIKEASDDDDSDDNLGAVQDSKSMGRGMRQTSLAMK